MAEETNLGQVISKTQEMILETSLFYIQNYQVHIKGKVE